MDASKMLERLESGTTFQNATEAEKAKLAALLLTDHVDPTKNNLKIFIDTLGENFAAELYSRLQDWSGE